VCVVDVSGGATGIPTGDGPAWDAVRPMLSDIDTDGTLRGFCLASPLVPVMPVAAAYAAPSFPAMRSVVDGALDLCTRIHEDFAYVPGATDVSTHLDDVFARREGVCQDFAHVTVACLRALGLPARYVSGYLETDPPPGCPRLIGADASHAWAEVFVPGFGWMGLDPTNGKEPGERYVVIAWGRDYTDVTPLKGVVYSSGNSQTLRVAVDVERLPVARAADQPAPASRA
jgi:transglutaminase-like putative cysteine protease